jgi:hypothetical protein
MMIQRLKARISLEQKGKFIALLNNLLNNDRVTRIKDIVDKFRLNARITEIQRRFLSRMLNTKAGRILTAFKAIKELPESRDLSAGVQFHNKLLEYALKPVRESFNKFKREETEGILRKRKAALLMIRNSMSSNKKCIDKWHNYAMTAKMYERARRLEDFMNVCNRT